MTKSLLVLICLFSFTIYAFAQDSINPKRKIFSWMCAGDIYYSYDFNQPADHQKPSFFYNYNRHNEINVNMAMIKASCTTEMLRGNFGIMTGTYPQYNMAGEPEIFRHIFEANIGVRLSKKKDFWLDAGIFPSHIGFESAIPADNNTLTRSMAADNSPYYETGLKLTYKHKSGKWLISSLLLNGWQRIRKEDGNKSICTGTQFTYTPSDKLSFNWSTYWGNDNPDSIRQYRFFNNFYASATLNQKWMMTLGFDIGWQQRIRDNRYDCWFTQVIVLQYLLSKKWNFTFRGEYFHDPKNIIIMPDMPGVGFKTFGLSLNTERKITDWCSWRTEYRLLTSKSPAFYRENTKVYSNNSATAALILKIQ